VETTLNVDEAFFTPVAMTAYVEIAPDDAQMLVVAAGLDPSTQFLVSPFGPGAVLFILVTFEEGHAYVTGDCAGTVSAPVRSAYILGPVWNAVSGQVELHFFSSLTDAPYDPFAQFKMTRTGADISVEIETEADGSSKYEARVSSADGVETYSITSHIALGTSQYADGGDSKEEGGLYISSTHEDAAVTSWQQQTRNIVTADEIGFDALEGGLCLTQQGVCLDVTKVWGGALYKNWEVLIEIADSASPPEVRHGPKRR